MALKINYTTGYAGTGKSYNLINLVNSLPLDALVVLAPTHKALHRLRGYLPEECEIKTIHSLLGWIPAINENAKKVEHIDITIKLDKDLAEYSHIIIDEAGMMSEDMFMEIISKVEEYAVFVNDEDEKEVIIHCFLDPYQLLPVKGLQIQTDPLTTVNLTAQYRAESPDIVALYTKFVHYLEGKNKLDLSTPYSENVLPLDVSQFKRGDRMLAYTNKAVGEWNIRIARQLGIKEYKGQEVQLGNMLDTILLVDWVDPDLNMLLRWFEQGILKLQNRQINTKFLEPSLQALIDNKYIKFIEGMDSKIYPVIVGIGNANIILKEAKVKAIENRKRFKEVYALGRAFIMDYSFATTVHKSQGSEFNRVFIDKADIQKSIISNYYKTYARLMYVAISRAKKKIFI